MNKNNSLLKEWSNYWFENIINNYNKEFVGYFDLLSENVNLTWDIVKANPNKSWDYNLLSSNPNITWDIIKANPNKKWSYEKFSENPNVTW